MFENGRKTIGVILCDVTETTRNGRGEANIVHLIPFEELDAIILCHDTLVNKPALDYVVDSIEKKCDCPVVTLRHDLKDYPAVLVNQEHRIEDLVYQFVDWQTVGFHLMNAWYMKGIIGRRKRKKQPITLRWNWLKNRK